MDGNINGNSRNIGYILTALMFGVLTTVMKYGGFGISDHIEQLPLIYKAIDSSYLSNDFFVNSGNQSLARLFYPRFMALLAGSDKNLPIVAFFMTMLVNASISLITYLFATRYFNNSGVSGLFASAAVMLVSTFALGWNDTIYHSVLIPASVAIPFLLAAIWATFDRRILTACILCISAVLFHPLMGLEIGYLLLFTAIFSAWYEKQLTRVRLKYILLSAMLLVACTVVVVCYEYGTGQQLDTTQFVYILAHLRHPHHYLPGSFDVTDYLYGGAFVITVAIILISRPGRCKVGDINAIVLVLFIMLLCVGGYFFVEVIPTRLWTIAQPFRLLYFVKWLGIIIVAGNISTYKVAGWQRLLLLPAMVHPYLMLCSNLILIAGEKRLAGNKYFNLIGIFSSVLVVLCLMLLKPEMSLLHWLLIMVLILMVANYYRFLSRLLLASLFLLVVLLLVNKKLQNYARMKAVAHKEKVKSYFSLDAGSYFANSEIITYIRTKTGEDDIFLTPPLWGELRLYAGRAIVVDFKAFPFNDSAMLEWYNRMTNCYGVTKEKGFATIGNYNDNYMTINDTKLMELKNRYRCSYAVLYNATSTSFDVVSADNYYKLVLIP